MSKNNSFLLPLLIAGSTIGGILLGYMIKSVPESSTIQSSFKQSEISVVDDILGYLSAKYVDSLDIDTLSDIAIASILEQLDPHTNYIAPDELPRINEQLRGDFEGIGIEFSIINDTLLVVHTIENGPSEKAGVKDGDKIIAVNGEKIANIKLNNDIVFSKLKGKKGSLATLDILRSSKKMTIKVIRDKVDYRSIDEARLLNDTTIYIKINTFSAKTYKEFMLGIEPYVKEGDNSMDIVIDLRQNGGGYLNEAIEILNQLFKSKELLVYTEGDHVKRNDYKTTGKPFFQMDDVVILVDEGSASASEIIAGAVQDNDRGKIIGRRTFGKGLVQEQYMLKNGGALRITTSHYYTPSGRSIQKPYAGIDYDADIAERFKTGELLTMDSLKQKDSLVFTTKKGRKVYGGGGITPDFFIPLENHKLDTGYVQRYYIAYEYMIKYTDSKRSILSKKSSKEIMEFIAKDPKIILALDEHIRVSNAEQKISLSPLNDKSRQALLYDLGIMALDLLKGDKEKFTIALSNDPFVKKALEVLE